MSSPLTLAADATSISCTGHVTFIYKNTQADGGLLAYTAKNIAQKEEENTKSETVALDGTVERSWFSSEGGNCADDAFGNQPAAFIPIKVQTGATNTSRGDGAYRADSALLADDSPLSSTTNPVSAQHEGDHTAISDDVQFYGYIFIEILEICHKSIVKWRTGSRWRIISLYCKKYCAKRRRERR